MLPCDWSLPAEPIIIRKAQSRKKAQKPLRTSWICPKMCLPCLIIIQSCYFDCRINEPCICFCCVICVSCSVHIISTYYTCPKDHEFFYLNYPQVNEVGQSGDMVVWPYPSPRGFLLLQRKNREKEVVRENLWLRAMWISLSCYDRCQLTSQNWLISNQ